MPSPGRPRTLDEAKRREICALVWQGCTIADAARYVGCSATTIHRERQVNEEFRNQLQSATLAAQLHPLNAMHRAISTHWRAAAWMLERLMPERFVRQNPLAFNRKHAHAMIADVLAIIRNEVQDPLTCKRLEQRVQTAIRCALRAAWDPERTQRDLRKAREYLDTARLNPLMDLGLSSFDPFSFVAPPAPPSSQPPRQSTTPPDNTAGKARNTSERGSGSSAAKAPGH
jgi:hypothetical protein